jgi:RNA polymerase sigma factor (sigma-70 family)
MLTRERKIINSYSNEIDFGVIFSIEKSIIENESSESVRNKLKLAVDGLTKRQKETVYLRFTRGLAYDEIAGIMGMEVESCRNTISRAIKTIRTRMKTLIVLFFNII